MLLKTYDNNQRKYNKILNISNYNYTTIFKKFCDSLNLMLFSVLYIFVGLDFFFEVISNRSMVVNLDLLDEVISGLLKSKSKPKSKHIKLLRWSTKSLNPKFIKCFILAKTFKNSETKWQKNSWLYFTKIWLLFDALIFNTVNWKTSEYCKQSFFCNFPVKRSNSG